MYFKSMNGHVEKFRGTQSANMNMANNSDMDDQRNGKKISLKKRGRCMDVMSWIAVIFIFALLWYTVDKFIQKRNMKAQNFGFRFY